MRRRVCERDACGEKKSFLVVMQLVGDMPNSLVALVFKQELELCHHIRLQVEHAATFQHPSWLT